MLAGQGEPASWQAGLGSLWAVLSFPLCGFLQHDRFLHRGKPAKEREFKLDTSRRLPQPGLGKDISSSLLPRTGEGWMPAGGALWGPLPALPSLVYALGPRGLHFSGLIKDGGSSLRSVSASFLSYCLFPWPSVGLLCLALASPLDKATATTVTETSRSPPEALADGSGAAAPRLLRDSVPHWEDA